MSPLTQKISRSTWYMLLAIYISMFALTVANIVYTNHVAQQTSRQWCGVLRIYHEAAKTNPAPASQYGRDILAQLEQLYTDFHCASVGKP